MSQQKYRLEKCRPCNSRTLLLTMTNVCLTWLITKEFPRPSSGVRFVAQSRHNLRRGRDGRQRGGQRRGRPVPPLVPERLKRMHGSCSN
eukprot:5146164-Pleurochrysis_carterae.AAC.4